MNPFDSALEIAAAIRRRDVSPVEVADTYLDRIDALDPGVNAVIWRNDEQVREAARRAESAVMRGDVVGPFHGVPIPVKNLSNVAGQPNDMSSLAVTDAPRRATALSIKKLQEAGFLLMGRTNSPELGPLTVTENAKYGRTSNPWDTDYVPGGSSGGAAAAVAAGFAPVAHASDGGGSIRVPSSACGLVGLKPSRGRVPQEVFAWEHSTVEGAITRTVADSAAMLDAMSVTDSLGWYSAPRPERPFAEQAAEAAGSLRIGLMLEAPTGLPVDPECVDAALALARLLEAAGHVVAPAVPRLFSREAIDAFQVIICASVAAGEYTDPSLVAPFITRRMERARDFNAVQYAAAAAKLQIESRAIVSQWGGEFDVLLTPTMATTTPKHGVVYEEANNDPRGEGLTALRMISFTSFCNTTGQPAISLPVHTGANGMPIGAQLVGAPFAEGTLLALAAQVEAAVNWQDRLAPLGAGVRP
ncbi:amidase [Paenarthrobacter sp. A20]|uniref:amidase n=1 Tax=Paenarthrobacter sp. A20 TaxID=2817891 RepID=UPI0020A065AC|nr:amidase [Paenarthrobacter sp. A20]MCP1415752.1 amidase [Paenarthrobacter sp. A20]